MELPLAKDQQMASLRLMSHFWETETNIFSHIKVLLPLYLITLKNIFPTGILDDNKM